MALLGFGCWCWGGPRGLGVSEARLDPEVPSDSSRISVAAARGKRRPADRHARGSVQTLRRARRSSRNRRHPPFAGLC